MTLKIIRFAGWFRIFHSRISPFFSNSLSNIYLKWEKFWILIKYNVVLSCKGESYRVQFLACHKFLLGFALFWCYYFRIFMIIFLWKHEKCQNFPVLNHKILVDKFDRNLLISKIKNSQRFIQTSKDIRQKSWIVE